MEIMLIRHFQTPGNLEKKYIGKTDEPLLINEKLWEYIEKKKEQLHSIGEPEDVVSSPMKRCIQTAGYLFPGKVLKPCPQMRECDFGEFEGKSYEELKDLPSYRKWLASRGRLPFPEGEGREAFQNRCVQGFREVVRTLMQRKCRLVAMVVHGGTIMAILSRLDSQGRDFYSWQIKNGEGFLFSLDEIQWQQEEKINGEIIRL